MKTCPNCFKVQADAALCDCGSRLREATEQEAAIGPRMNALIDANRIRDLYFRYEEQGTVNVVLIPKDWGDSFCIREGFTGGPDNQEDGPELYGYGPTNLTNNDPEVETLFFPLSKLVQCEEISESQARILHSNLFEHLDKINRGEI
jgi:hypothetical protein